MMKRALLIGAETFGLRGVLRDVDRMGEALRRFDFDITTCAGDVATRDEILKAYDAFIDGTGPGDAVVVYYSGHGGIVTTPAPAATVPCPRHVQFIGPADYTDDSLDPSSFRGILGYELSARLARLTDRARDPSSGRSNATIILDCCHAMQMSRATTRMTAKALPRPVALAPEACFALLRERGIDPAHLPVQGNPDAVRFAACGLQQSAYEDVGASGEHGGVMTDALLFALENVRTGEDGSLPVSWRRIGEWVRERVLRATQTQRPEVEGPAERYVFGTNAPAPETVLTVRARAGRLVLAGGYVMGAREGDAFAIMPIGAERADDASQLGVATVRRVDALEAAVDVNGETPSAQLDGLPAFLVHRAAARWPVRVAGETPARDEVANAIRQSPLLAVAGEVATNETVRITVSVDAGMLSLRDRVGELLPPSRYASARLPVLVDNLERLAVAEAVRNLTSSPGADADTKTGAALVSVEVGLVLDGACQPLPEVLTPGCSAYVKLINDDSRPRFFHVFNVGAAHKVTYLTPDAPSGVRVAAGQVHVVGADVTGRLVGLDVVWPDDVPRDAPREELIVAIVTYAEHDLRALETDSLVRMGTRGKGSAESELEQLVRSVRRGGTRSLLPMNAGRNDPYVVVQIPFVLHPDMQAGNVGSAGGWR